MSASVLTEPRVSIEVDPRIAHDGARTAAEACGLWWLVDRPNLFIKIPATLAGLPAITDFLQSTLLPGGSQHASSTLHVNQTSLNTATVTSYLQAIFFGFGDTKGLVYQNYGYYEDQMVKQATGKWLVQSRVIHNFVSFRSTGLRSLQIDANMFRAAPET